MVRCCIQWRPFIHNTGSIQYGDTVAIVIDAAYSGFYNGLAMSGNEFSRLERLLRETVEGSFGRLFGSYLEPMDVATQLVAAMEDHTAHQDKQISYDVLLHPDDLQLLLERNPDLNNELALAAWEIGKRYGLVLPAQPVLRLLADESGRRRRVRISPRLEAPDLDVTQVNLSQVAGSPILGAIRALDAYLVVQGKRHVALDEPLVTIGRRPDNDIVLNASSVSRQHAQIRWRFDRFVLYDISNRGRTAVNGEAVHEAVLRPGDVLAFSDVFCVYGEGHEERSRDGSAASQAGNTLVYLHTNDE